MTSQPKMIPMQEIVRRQLPALERKGVLAQEVPGSEILVITLHQVKTDFETMAGVAAEVSSKLRELEPGVSDTVLLGSVSRGGSVALLDVLMVQQRSQRGKPWKDRIEVLRQTYEKLPEDFRHEYRLAWTYTRGLMKVFDGIVENGGAGLLLRVKGQSKAVFCR